MREADRGAPAPTVVQSTKGTLFRLRWDEPVAPDGALPGAGVVDFQHTDAGLVNLSYQSTVPPPAFPILCPSASNCGNSMAGAMYLAIWGSRSPVLAEPLLRRGEWNSVGGTGDDVTSASRYVGRATVRTPAFPAGVAAAKVESTVTQAVAIGDPFGTGVRTVWWVRGVGPVLIRFLHAGGEVSRAELVSTTLVPKNPPADANYLPFAKGDRAVFRWRNSKHMPRWSQQRFDVAQVVNNTARVDVRNMSGQIAVAGSYTFATRLNGVTQLSAFTRSQTRLKFPALGPRSAPADRRRHFVTPYDLLVYGFDPALPAYPTPGHTWHSTRTSRAWRVFGVSGSARVLPKRRMHTPAGTFQAIGVRTALHQAGFPFGSGIRTSWFAAGMGLVRLVFRHGDGSVSTVERLR